MFELLLPLRGHCVDEVVVLKRVSINKTLMGRNFHGGAITWIGSRANINTSATDSGPQKITAVECWNGTIKRHLYFDIGLGGWLVAFDGGDVHEANEFLRQSSRYFKNPGFGKERPCRSKSGKRQRAWPGVDVDAAQAP